MGEAILDSNSAWDDLRNRLELYRDDLVAGLQNEVDDIKDAIERTEVDRKDACKVLRALRADILQNISCDSDATSPDFGSTYDASDSFEFREYEGFFDGFHYDIGHGKGTGEGSLPGGKSKSNYNSQFGDYEIDVGGATRSFY